MTGEVYGREAVALLTAAEAADLDARARDDGVPERALMENAGRAAAQVIDRLFPAGRIVAVVGSGNNGGDALVALRSLRSWGRDVAFLKAGSGDPDTSLLTGFDIPCLDPSDPSDRSDPPDRSDSFDPSDPSDPSDLPDAAGPSVDAVLARAAVIVDGILGTGARGEPRERAAAMIRRMNGSGRPIVALDIPSGVDPTTGAVPGEAVSAAATIQFGWPKTGALLQPGRARCGRIIAVEIGFPPLVAGDAGAAVITPDWARARLPRRNPSAHKNSVGRVLVVAGNTGVAGAAGIAGRSATRAGAGYVRVATVEANRAIIQTLVPEALFVDRDDHAALRAAVGQSDAILIGPGVGTDGAAEAALDLVLEGAGDRGLVLDADALTMLARREGGFDGLGRRALLTPHPGEMSRVTGLDVAAIRADPIGRARELADRIGAAVLLKGAPSVVATPGAPVLVASGGSSDLATAGMGDQLGAAAAAFMAAGVDPSTAGGLALFFGSRAAELAGRGRSLTPHDVAALFHLAFDDAGPARSPLALPFVLFDQPTRW
jgi:ADP-dependent NAD(P)H-hydrate dehydratase / NAD(P)H-hydrate epimerase